VPSVPFQAVEAVQVAAQALGSIQVQVTVQVESQGVVLLAGPVASAASVRELLENRWDQTALVAFVVAFVVGKFQAAFHWSQSPSAV